MNFKKYDKNLFSTGGSFFYHDEDGFKNPGLEFEKLLSGGKMQELSGAFLGDLGKELAQVENDIFGGGGGHISFSIPSKNLGIGVFIENNTYTSTSLWYASLKDWHNIGAVAFLPNSADYITPKPGGIMPLLDGTLTQKGKELLYSHSKLTGVSITDMGVTFATEIFGINVGSKQKLQHLAIIGNRIEAANTNGSLFGDITHKFAGNLDIGLQKTLFSKIHLALVATNLIPYTFETNENDPEFAPIKIRPQVTAGLAISPFNWIYAEVNYDFFNNIQFGGQNVDIEISPIDDNGFTEIGDVTAIEGTQNLKIGLELGKLEKTLGVVRFGYVHDFNDTQADIYSAGLGANIFGFTIDAVFLTTDKIFEGKINQSFGGGITISTPI